jgi:hypothetical protein
MSCLNYYIALHANREDGCTGHFWEGRFKSQALLDAAALLSCMAYVDLNPVRAGIAQRLEDSDYTSIQARIRQLKSQQEEETPALMLFDANETDQQHPMKLPYGLKDYLELVDWSGRLHRADKKRHLSDKRPRLLTSLGLSPGQWKLLAQEIQKEAITMLNGLDKVVRMEKRPKILKSA